MSHNHNPVLGAHELFQSLCLHPCLHTGVLLYLLGFAPKIGDGIPVLDHYLIAAAAKGHLDGNTAVLIVLQIVGTVQSDTDT